MNTDLSSVGSTGVEVHAAPQVAQAHADEVSVLTVEGMTCVGCEAAVKLAAKTVDGVTDCTAD